MANGNGRITTTTDFPVADQTWRVALQQCEARARDLIDDMDTLQSRCAALELLAVVLGAGFALMTVAFVLWR